MERVLSVLQPSVAILIPAYEPNEAFVGFVRRLKEIFSRIIVVDDGSQDSQEIFGKISDDVEKVLRHEQNRGKGAAIKTGLRYVGNSANVVIADCDGQHTIEDISRIASMFARQKNGIILGARKFSGKVPFRSRFGNWWTRFYFFLATGMKLRDTQTGLRGIPSSLVEWAASLPGERYEYEMAMLVASKRNQDKPLQIEIETVYFDNNKSSHFSPLVDTWRIYKMMFGYALSGKKYWGNNSLC